MKTKQQKVLKKQEKTEKMLPNALCRNTSKDSLSPFSCITSSLIMQRGFDCRSLGYMMKSVEGREDPN